MIRFRTLGSVSLMGGDRSVERVLAQPTLVALLTFLVVSPPPGGFVRRDSLLGAFWPETDQAHARHALRQGLYRLRSALGSRVLRTRGDEEVGIDIHELWSDVQAFERRCRIGQIDRALDLYRGDFLQGFFLPRSPAFEDWMDRERSDLRERAADAAWTLAERMEREERLREAVRWARRATRIVPYDEAGLRRGITLLARVGDVAGALHLYDDFARAVRREYETEPSSVTLELVARVRRGMPPAEGESVSGH